MVDVLILAGSFNDGALSSSSNKKYEALIDICSRPMVEYVIKGTRDSKYVNRIALVGPIEALRKELKVEPDIYIDMDKSLFDNLKKGMDRLGGNELILVVTGDIPLISSAAIDDFIEQAQTKQGDIFYPIISQEACETAYPGVKRTYARLKEGVFTGGNIVLLKPQVITDIDSPLGKAIHHRKSTWQLSRLLGLPFLFLFLMGRLSIVQIEEKVFRTFGYNGIGIIINYPEVAFDVDKPLDLELISRYLQEKTGCA